MCAVPSSVKTPVPSPQCFCQNPAGLPGTATPSQSPALPWQPRECRTDAAMSIQKGGLGERLAPFSISPGNMRFKVENCLMKLTAERLSMSSIGNYEMAHVDPDLFASFTVWKIAYVCVVLLVSTRSCCNVRLLLPICLKDLCCKRNETMFIAKLVLTACSCWRSTVCTAKTGNGSY